MVASNWFFGPFLLLATLVTHGLCTPPSSSIRARDVAPLSIDPLVVRSLFSRDLQRRRARAYMTVAEMKAASDEQMRRLGKQKSGRHGHFRKYFTPKGEEAPPTGKRILSTPSPDVNPILRNSASRPSSPVSEKREPSPRRLKFSQSTKVSDGGD